MMPRRRKARRSRTVTRVKSRRRISRSMPRRRRVTRRTRRVSAPRRYGRRARRGIGSIFRGGYIGKGVMGIGSGTIARIGASYVIPQHQGIADLVGGFLGGGLVGGAINAVVKIGLTQQVNAPSFGGLLGRKQGNGGML